MKTNIAKRFSNLFKIDRTILRGTEDILHNRKRIRVVVLGSKGSGKTVFLTALASNLINHRRGNGFDLNQWEAHTDKYKKPKDETIPDFPYTSYREGFARSVPEWPKKTTQDMTVLRIPLVFKKECKSDVAVLLEFLDLPGERLADLTMIGKSYREWCDWFQASFSGPYTANCDYVNYLCEARNIQDKNQLFACYRKYLRAEHKKFSPWVVPSIVKLTKEGKATEFLKELDQRPLGIDWESQFVPVPFEFFTSKDQRKQWVSDFSKAYDKYKKIIVAPMDRWLREADQLVYLLDVLNILKGGVEVYNHEKKFGEAILKLFAKNEYRFIGGSILSYLSRMVTTRIKNAFVVVPKRDLAVPEDGDKLIKLADSMMGKELSGLVDGKSSKSVMTCAAVDTVLFKRSCEGREVPYARTTSNASESVYQQVRVPGCWPSSDDWRKTVEEYWFDDTWPLFDEREDASPRQLGLDNLAKALLRSELR